MSRVLHALPVMKDPVPTWLAQATPDSVSEGQFPLKDILSDSLYYPAAGFDCTPVEYLAGCMFSFIYVDCGYTREELTQQLTQSIFDGYECIGRRSVTVCELFPLEVMHEVPLPFDLYEELGYQRFWGLHRRLQGDDRAPRDTRDLLAKLDYLWGDSSFCDWFVFQRETDLGNEHGPYKFSWLYIHADGRRAFERLYVANYIVPKAVAIIQAPGFECWDGIFAKCVLHNPAGHPEMLLFGGAPGPNRNHETYWPGYRKPYVHELERIWRKTRVQPHELRSDISDTAFLADYIKDRPDTRSDLSIWFSH